MAVPFKVLLSGTARRFGGDLLIERRLLVIEASCPDGSNRPETGGGPGSSMRGCNEVVVYWGTLLMLAGLPLYAWQKWNQPDEARA